MNDGANRAGHERCGGRTRRGTPCKLPAGHSTSHPGVGRCDHHGGATPTHEEHARRVLLGSTEESALAELRHLDVHPMGNPLEALCELAAEARQWGTILRRQVAELESLSQMTPAGTEQLRPVVLLFERAMDRAAAFAASLAKLNIDERIFKLNERIGKAQGEAVALAIERILVALGHADPRNDPHVAEIVVREIGAIEAPGDE
jgi:hypothetical protein